MIPKDFSTDSSPPHRPSHATPHVPRTAHQLSACPLQVAERAASGAGVVPMASGPQARVPLRPPCRAALASPRPRRTAHPVTIHLVICQSTESPCGFLRLCLDF